MRLLRAVLASLAATAVALVAFVAPASADANFPSTVNPGDMRWCTSTQPFCQQVLAHIGLPTTGKMVCYWDDQNARWFYVFLFNGQEGYVHSSMIPVATQTSTPACTSINWLNVSNWTIARLGAVTATSADGSIPPGGYWSGYCLTFAHDAWNPWGGIVAPTNANSLPNNIWDWFGANQPAKRHTGGRPPRGALVFWGTSPTWHIAISMGDWQAIGTRGYAGDHLPVSFYNINSDVSNYTGWVMPQDPTVAYNAS